MKKPFARDFKILDGDTSLMVVADRWGEVEGSTSSIVFLRNNILPTINSIFSISTVGFKVSDTVVCDSPLVRMAGKFFLCHSDPIFKYASN